MNYLAAYPEEIQLEVQSLASRNRLVEMIKHRYFSLHDIKSDNALYRYVMGLKNTYFRHVRSPDKIVFANDFRSIQRALGLNTIVYTVQGDKLKSKTEIKIASLFKHLPIEFLKMIVAHELAHLKEREHNKAFYKLCLTLEQNYHHIEFDLRICLTYENIIEEIGWHPHLY